METRTGSLFCDTSMTRRIEKAEVDLVSAANAGARLRGTSGFLIPIAGGVASFADHGSPYNKVTGVGFEGVPEPDQLEQIEAAYAALGAPTQVELAHLADPAVGELLTARGYRLESFENVLGRSLDPAEERTFVPDVEVRLSPDDEFESWVSVLADAAAQPDTGGLPWHEEFPRATYVDAERDAANAGVRRYAAWLGSFLAGGAGLRFVDHIAQFAGAGTAPPYRRRGVQNALLSARLADAAAAGCDLAVIVAQPGSKSHQNAQRRGFDVLYTRAILAKRSV
jgi:GNAT superfamily N-acetyltransferase